MVRGSLVQDPAAAQVRRRSRLRPPAPGRDVARPPGTPHCDPALRLLDAFLSPGLLPPQSAVAWTTGAGPERSMSSLRHGFERASGHLSAAPAERRRRHASIPHGVVAVSVRPLAGGHEEALGAAGDRPALDQRQIGARKTPGGGSVVPRSRVPGVPGGVPAGSGDSHQFVKPRHTLRPRVAVPRTPGPIPPRAEARRSCRCHPRRGLSRRGSSAASSGGRCRSEGPRE